MAETAKPRNKPTKLTPKANAILDCKAKHPELTTREIGTLVDCDYSHVSRVLTKYGLNEANLTEYKKNRADIFAGIQGKILESINDDDIKKASLMQKSTAMAVLYDKERLERGESTQNVLSIHGDIAEMKRLRMAQDGKTQGD